jgi:hypothetical protein
LNGNYVNEKVPQATQRVFVFAEAGKFHSLNLSFFDVKHGKNLSVKQTKHIVLFIKIQYKKGKGMTTAGEVILSLSNIGNLPRYMLYKGSDLFICTNTYYDK